MNRIYTFLATLAVVFGLQAQNVQSQKSEVEIANDGPHKGLDFSISTGYHVGVGDMKNVGSIPVEISLGKQFRPNLYLGLGSGVWIGTKDSKPMVPITLDSKLMFPSSTSSMKPIVNFRLGYLLCTQGENYPDYIMMELMPGVQFPISSRTDFMLSAGYTHSFVTKGSGSGGYFSVKAGINFHKNPFHVRRPRREKVGTRDHGVQLTLEGGANFMTGGTGSGANLVIGYKLNPHLSIGVGAGGSGLSPFEESGEGVDIQIVSVDKQNETSEEKYYDYQDSFSEFKFFVRGTYRLTEKRLSPFATIDVGARLYSMDSYNLSSSHAELPDDMGYFAAPAIGLSLRTTNNSYLELKGGFLMSTRMGNKGYTDEGIYYSCRSVSLSAPFVSLGFTHTFGKRGKRP